MNLELWNRVFDSFLDLKLREFEFISRNFSDCLRVISGLKIFYFF